MTFRRAVEETANLGARAYRPGIQALENVDRARIACAKPRNLSGSVNVDSTLAPIFRNDNRWDYAVGYRRPREIVYWIEVHPASQGDIITISAKLAWLQGWLANVGHRFRQIDARFVWISSGRTTFTPGSPALKRLALQGVQVVGRMLTIG